MIKKTLLLCVSIPILLGFRAEGSLLEKDKDGDEKSRQKILLIALVGNLNNRKTLEEEIRYSMIDAGMQAVSSYSSGMSIKERPTKEDVIKTCERLGADGVLLIKILDTKEKTDINYTKGKSTTSVYVWGPYPFTHGGNYTGNANSKVTLLAEVYSVPNGERILVYQKKVTIISDMEGVIGKYAQQLTKRLKSSRAVAVN